MQIKIEIHTTDPISFLKSSVFRSNEIRISDQVTLRNDGIFNQYGVDFPQVVYFVLDISKQIAAGTASGIAAAWLYENLIKNKKDNKIEKLVIERTEVEFERGSIKKIIEEKLKTEI